MSSVIARVQRRADAEIARQRALLADLGPDVADLLDVCEDLLQGGKRLRASFLVWGYCSVAGMTAEDAPEGVIDLATAMELFQAGALIHDDVMDGSDTRRGAPAAHVRLAARHRDRGWLGPADRTGLAGAVLAGNLCLGAAEDLVAGAELPAAASSAVRAMFATMRTQLMAGQYLDVVESVRPWDDLPGSERLQRADRVIRFKSAKYSVEHPVLIGALAAGADQGRIDALSRYGLSIGRAFQLRDDLLGVFGDPAVTGKPAGDDLREGKRTVLVAAALERLDPEGRARLLAGLGRPEPDTVAALQEQIAGTGAVDWVESRIAALVSEASSALADTDLSDEGYAALTDLADQATRRIA